MYRSLVSCMTKVCEVDGHIIVRNDRLCFVTKHLLYLYKAEYPWTLEHLAEAQNPIFHLRVSEHNIRSFRVSKVVYTRRWFFSNDSYITY